MVCPKCKELNQESRLYPEGGFVTAMHPEGGFVTAMYYPTFYDEKGVVHNHDHNIHTMGYHCSKGHKFITKGHPSCPNCDFGGNEEIEYRD
jgi:hypothetical protein